MIALGVYFLTDHSFAGVLSMDSFSCFELFFVAANSIYSGQNLRAILTAASAQAGALLTEAGA